MKKNSIKLIHGLLIFLLIGLFQFCDIRNIDGGIEYSIEDQKLLEYCDLEAGQGFTGVIALMRPDQEILYKCIGYSDQGELIENDQYTVFDIGSLTKQFTGAAILKLEMEGKISVTDSLSKYFPDIPEDKEGITIHHLLTHSAGFPRMLGSDFENLRKEEFLID